MKKYLAELVGTFVLVLGGCGSAVLAGDTIGPLGIALAFGCALLAMVYAIGPISGCHINPAVTISMWASKKLNRRDTAGYIMGQLIGSVLASLLLLIIVSGAPIGTLHGAATFAANGYGDHSPGHYTLLAAFLTEVTLTGVLMGTVLGATAQEASAGFAGIPIGIVLVLIHLVSIPVTNTSVNPTRSIGPALVVGGWAVEQLWLFIVAPIIGALLGATLYQRMSHLER